MPLAAKGLQGRDQVVRQGIEANPEQCRVRLPQGIGLRGLGKKSKKPCTTWRRSTWTRITPWLGNGRAIFFASGSAGQAVDYYSRAIDANPLDKEAFMLRGNAQTSLGNLPEAVTDYNLVLALDADDPDAWFNLANVQVRQNNAYEAMKAYSMVLEKRPGDRDAHLNRGIILLALELKDDARIDFDSAIAADTTFATSWWNKAFLHAELEQYDEAMTAVLKATELAPKEPEGWLLMGRIFFKQRRYKDAIAAYDRCISLDKTASEAFLNRGEAKRVLGDYKGACKDWHQVLKVDTGPTAEKAQVWIEINCRD
ncbi:MAG: tetratricopeptide repeat protein [Bacteroidia bacterium]